MQCTLCTMGSHNGSVGCHCKVLDATKQRLLARPRVLFFGRPAAGRCWVLCSRCGFTHRPAPAGGGGQHWLSDTMIEQSLGVAHRRLQMSVCRVTRHLRTVWGHQTKSKCLTVRCLQKVTATAKVSQLTVSPCVVLYHMS